MLSKINLNKIIQISKSVGDDLVEYKNKNDIKFKYVDNELKTSADEFANNKIKKLLSHNFNNINIISEEDKSSKTIFNNTFTGFIIDPIDGTSSFFENFKTYVTQIAYAENGIIIIGVVYSPELDMIFFAEKGQGAYYNHNLIEPNTNVNKSILIDNTPKPSNYIKKIMKTNKIKNYYESGSIGLKISLIASNQADLMIKPDNFKIWDIAAPLAILNEVNGTLYELNKNKITIDKINKNDFIGLIACSSNINISDIKI